MAFHKTYGLESAMSTIQEALAQQAVAGDGPFTLKCSQWLKNTFGCHEALMTTSCTHALELAVHALELKAGDEVILPSFTYPSTANAVLLGGGRVVFSEVEAKHLTLDPKRIEEKITPHTKAIIVVHYAGNLADMDPILEIAERYGLRVIEDAAQGFLSKYKGRYAGTLGHLGCLSFHGTKDIIAGEGGALLINAPEHTDRCQSFRLKGTNKEPFSRGLVPHYEWVGLGSSFSPSDLLMALLWSQLALSDSIVSRRRHLLERYIEAFGSAKIACLESVSSIPTYCESNGHLFYLIFRDKHVAKAFMQHLELSDIKGRTHFIPLHESTMGSQFIRENNDFGVERGLGQRLVRLPLYPDLSDEAQLKVIETVHGFLREVL